MLKRFAIIVATFALVLPLGGCSESPVQPAGGGASSATLLDGEVGPTTGDFDIMTRTSGDPAVPLQGPFLIRGRNVHYDTDLGALVVDISVENAGQVAHPEPIGLTFLNMLPAGITVLNPDNEENGNGAAIEFQFENDDAMWTPGEESFLRTVQFGVDPGTAIAFVARLDIGVGPTGGTIRGLVWNDLNRDGMIDPGEDGIPGVQIILVEGSEPDSVSTNAVRRTRTGPSGEYWFDNLRPGFYTVMKGSLRQYLPTTPSVLHVVLVETDDGVSDFLMANFGCVSQERPNVDVQVGDYVEVTGTFERADGPRVVARGIEVEHIDDRIMMPMVLRRSELRGPVTDINLDRRALAVMGTWVKLVNEDPAGDTTADRLADTDPNAGPVSKLRLEDVEVGDRVRVIVPLLPDDSGAPLEGSSLREWNGRHDKVHGYVVRRGGPDGRPAQLLVVRTLIEVTPGTEIVPMHDLP